MRRTDRQVTDAAEIKNIIEHCNCLHLGLSDGEAPYVVPLNFGFEMTKTGYIFYFHGAKEGKKLDLIRKNPQVALCMDTEHGLVAGESAANYSYRYASVMGQGKAEILTAREEKLRGLTCILGHYAPEQAFSVPERLLEETAVVKITAEALTAKRRK